MIRITYAVRNLTTVFDGVKMVPAPDIFIDGRYLSA